MKEAYVKSLNDLLANSRIDNPDNVDEIWKYFKEKVLPVTENICGGSKRPNGYNRHGSGMIPLMM